MSEAIEASVPPFQRIPLPDTTARWARSVKAKRVRMYARMFDGVITTVLVSRDPSGPNGEREDHASIATRSANNGASMPVPDREIDAVLRFLGWQENQCEWVHPGGWTLHLYKRKP